MWGAGCASKERDPLGEGSATGGTCSSRTRRSQSLVTYANPIVRPRGSLFLRCGSQVASASGAEEATDASYPALVTGDVTSFIASLDVSDPQCIIVKARKAHRGSCSCAFWAPILGQL